MTHNIALGTGGRESMKHRHRILEYQAPARKPFVFRISFEGVFIGVALLMLGALSAYTLTLVYPAILILLGIVLANVGMLIAIRMIIRYRDN